MSEMKSLISRAEKLEHINAWRASGLTQAAYCREHQLKETTFNGWILRGVALPETSSLTTVPVIIQPKTPSGSTVPILVQHGAGWQLALPADVQINWLAQLLNALA